MAYSSKSTQNVNPTLLQEWSKEAVGTPEKANTAAQPAPSPLTVRKIQPLQNPALKQYLQKRCIDVEIAAPYLQEIYYQRNEKNYFALAFANASGGYELRNPYFQGTFGTKDVTVLSVGVDATGSSVAIFEGFMDFLSALTYTGKERPDGMAIVLNSAPCVSGRSR